MTTSVEEQVESLRASAGEPGADVAGIANQLAELSEHAADPALGVTAQRACVDVLTSFDPLIGTDSGQRMLLAEELHNLAVRLIAADQNDEAVSVAQQAITTYREAGALPGPNIEELARNLTILQKQLCSINDLADALAAQQVAVDLLRTPVASDPDAVRQELLADALFNLAARLIDVQRGPDAAAPGGESADAYAAVVTTLRGSLAASAVSLTALAASLATDGLVDVADQARQAAVAAASADVTAPLPSIDADGAPSADVAAAAAAVERVRSLQLRVGTDEGELRGLATLLSGAGLDSAAQHALSLLDFPTGLSAAESPWYCVVAGPEAVTPTPGASFGSLRGRWPQGNLKVVIRTEDVQGQAAPVAVTAIRNAFRTWAQAARDVANGFFTFEFVLEPTLDSQIIVYFTDTSLVPEFAPGNNLNATSSFPGQGDPVRIALNMKHSWAAEELEAVTLHEIGHALGFTDSHTTSTPLSAPPGDPNPVIAPHPLAVSTMFPASRNTVLDAETLSALRAAYGWSPQRQLTDRGTEHRPSLGVVNHPGGDMVKMVWKGIGDGAIWQSDFLPGRDAATGDPVPSADNWSAQSDLSAELLANTQVLAVTSHRPALAQITAPSPSLLMAWRDPAAGRLKWTRNLGGRWADAVQEVPGAASTEGPTLTSSEGTVYMAWKGRDGDGGLWYARFDQAAVSWTPQRSVNAGPDHGPVGTIDSPALVEHGGRLHIFWKGAEGDDTIWTSSVPLAGADAADWPEQTRVVSRTFPEAATAIGATSGPWAALRYDSRLWELTRAQTDVILLAWKGAKGDPLIYMNESDGTSTSGQVNVPGRATSTGPAVVQALGSTIMAWKGMDSDDTIWWSRL